MNSSVNYYGIIVSDYMEKSGETDSYNAASITQTRISIEIQASMRGILEGVFE